MTRHIILRPLDGSVADMADGKAMEWHGVERTAGQTLARLILHLTADGEVVELVRGIECTSHSGLEDAHSAIKARKFFDETSRG